MVENCSKGKLHLKLSTLTAPVNALLDLAMPPQSLLTGNPAVGGVEGDLWGEIRFLDNPCCELCGFPFDFAQGEDALCGRCIARPPAYDHARAAFSYDDNSRKLVLDFKHGGRTHGLKTFGAHMSRAGRAFLPEADFIIPVPLHASRLVKRRYNQSVLLARALRPHTPASFDPDILMRTRATPSQGGQTAIGRHRNVQGAFKVRPGAIDRLRGKRVVIIDDVMTTGATLGACSKTLKRAGALKVDALVLARVVRGAPLPT